jgi:hypothetical protein
MSRVRNLLTGAAFALASVVPAQAVCIPANFPANWLPVQENAGGHTIARHVGRTDNQLTARLQNEGLNAVGSYPTAGPPTPWTTAQGTISAGVTVNRNVINNWAANANVNATMAYNYVSAANIGRVATWDNGLPPAPVVGNTCTFRVVVRATGAGNCYVLTSFPTPPGGANCP